MSILDLEHVSAWPAELLAVLDREHDVLLDQERPVSDPYASRPLEEVRETVRKRELADRVLAGALRHFSLIGWHCTRLTVGEIERMAASGLELLSAESARRRIERVVASGEMPAQLGDILKAKNQAGAPNRAGRLCFCFYPPRLAGEGGIERLLRQWGGEALYWSHEHDPAIAPLLKAIGTPALVEADVPIELLAGGFLTKNVACRYLINRGDLKQDPVNYENAIVRPLPAERVRRLIRFPERDFLALTGCADWRDPLR